MANAIKDTAGNQAAAFTNVTVPTGSAPPPTAAGRNRTTLHAG